MLLSAHFMSFLPGLLSSSAGHTEHNENNSRKFVSDHINAGQSERGIIGSDCQKEIKNGFWMPNGMSDVKLCKKAEAAKNDIPYDLLKDLINLLNLLPPMAPKHLSKLENISHTTWSDHLSYTMYFHHSYLHTPPIFAARFYFGPYREQ